MTGYPMLFRLVFAAALLAQVSGCGTIDRLTGSGEEKRLRERGVPATAVVQKLWETGVSVNDNPVVGFDLEVHLDGRPPYAVQTRGLVSILHIPQLQPGAVIGVLVDPDDPSRVALAIYDR